MLSYAEALKRPPPSNPQEFNTNQTNILFRKIKGYDGQPLTVVRQFSCRDCMKMWWRRVRSFKQVSSCQICKQKYDPIPVDLEFGCGFFECTNCENKFTGRAQMGKTSRCYACNTECHPSFILNKRDDVRIRLTRNRHSCSFCHGVGICPAYHQILVFSELHIPTGSTLRSLNIQNDLDERFIDDFEERNLPFIRESSSEHSSFNDSE